MSSKRSIQTKLILPLSVGFVICLVVLFYLSGGAILRGLNGYFSQEMQNKTDSFQTDFTDRIERLMKQLSFFENSALLESAIKSNDPVEAGLYLQSIKDGSSITNAYILDTRLNVFATNSGIVENKSLLKNNATVKKAFSE